MQVTRVAHLPTTIQPSMPMPWASSQGDAHSKGKAREEALEMHAESVGSGVIKEALTVLPSERNAESVAKPITSKLSASVETVPGVPPLVKARQARREGRSHLAKKTKYQADSVVLREVNSQKENSVLSAPTDTEVASKESRDSVLSGPPLQAEHSIPTNKFSCCEITSRPDGSSTAQDQVYTDTDPEGRLAIYTDMLVRPYKAAKVTSMEVKVDPGAEGSLMPVCHFRRLFPQLCLDGQPKEGVLQKADSRFESYSGNSVQILGHITFQVQNIQTRRYKPIRFYVIDRESGPVLLGHAACHWLSMITVQCFNKAQVHKKFIASVSKDGPERSFSSSTKLGPLRSKQDMYTDAGRLKNQVAKARAKKLRRRKVVNPWTDVIDGKTDRATASCIERKVTEQRLK